MRPAILCGTFASALALILVPLAGSDRLVGAESTSAPTGWAPGSLAPGPPASLEEPTDLLTIDHSVPHVSSVPANEGDTVELFVRERVRPGHHRHPRVVLMVQGGTTPTVPIFDLRFQDYSWIAFLARAGFDVFAMDLTGYGFSPRPTMDNPCNASRSDQEAFLIPNPLSEPCEPSYPFRLSTSQSDWDEIDTVVEYLRELRHVDRVSLIGWSLGGPRAGGYAARHPDKVERLLLYAPNYDRSEPSDPPPVIPESGVPMRVRTIASFFSDWDSEVQCLDQFTPAIRDALSPAILAADPLGSTWGTQALWRAPVQNTRWGWNQGSARWIQAPTLIIRGDLDTVVPEKQPRNLYADCPPPKRSSSTWNVPAIGSSGRTNTPSCWGPPQSGCAMEHLQTGQRGRSSSTSMGMFIKSRGQGVVRTISVDHRPNLKESEHSDDVTTAHHVDWLRTSSEQHVFPWSRGRRTGTGGLHRGHSAR